MTDRINNDEHDVFISYRWVSPDREWVREELVPALKAAGLRPFLDVDDFIPGRDLMLEMTRAGLSSRSVLCVLSPAYFEGNRMVSFEALNARRADPSGQQSKLIPFVLREAVLPDWIAGLVPVDWTDPDGHGREWRKLLRALVAANPDSPPPRAIDSVKSNAPLSSAMSPLEFISIGTHASDRYWREGKHQTHHDKIDREAAQYFGIDFDSENWNAHSDPVNADPIFSITVKNKINKSVIISRLGVVISEVAHCNYLWGFPGSTRILESEFYALEMPNLRERFKDKYSGFELTPQIADELVPYRLSDPIYIDAHGPFRFGLRLLKFCERLPNHVRLRIWCETDCGEAVSRELALRSY